MIENITLSNIKGISNKSFDVNIPKNKPTLIVAPNGFGKSSLAIAFDSLRTTRIELHKDHYHEDDETKPPTLSVRFAKDDGTTATLVADNNRNEIFNDFGVFVINSQIKARAKSGFEGRRPSASLEIETITIIDTIPAKILFDYSYSAAKRVFGNNGKVLPDIATLLSNKSFLEKVDDIYVEIEKLSGIRIQKTISDFKADLNLQSGNKDVLQRIVTDRHVQILETIAPIVEIAQVIKCAAPAFNAVSISYLAVIQISELYHTDSSKFKKAVKYAKFSIDKHDFENLLTSFNTAWKEIKPKKSGSSLVVEFPKAHHLSNGQRDILCFIALILRARRKLNKANNLLIIDEVFDYLDEANLVAAQYFVTKFIEDSKSSGRNIYPLILTHLNPQFFQHYSFKKPKVIYLDKKNSAVVNQHLKELLLKREDAAIKKNVAKFLLHYYPAPFDFCSVLLTLHLFDQWGNGTLFSEFVQEEARKYLENIPNHDPLAVCCAVRKKVEEIIYFLLPTDQAKDEFVELHGTKKKLEYAIEIGIDVPEYFFMLGIIYNDGLHWHDGQDNVSGIAAKLEHFTIKELIRKVFE